MPINSIITQPVTSAITAAYRPIIFVVRASRTDNQPLPPVVYCDIYFNGVYYKTLQKTQYKVLNASNSDWQFDIQDACQEILAKVLGPNGGTSIIQASGVMSLVYCKFRSSGLDSNGFITTEGTAPIQGTGTTAATAGTGTQSHSFYVVNSTLQHEHNQDYPSHLNAYKKGTWATNAYPLSHRQDNYRIGRYNSDYYPIIYLGGKALSIKLYYREKKDTLFKNPPPIGGGGGTSCGVAAFITAIVADTQTGGNYKYIATFSFTGGAPALFVVQFSTNGTTWNNVFNQSVSGSTVTYDIGVLADTNHTLKITPYCSPTLAGTAGTGTYTAGSTTGCVPVAIPSGTTMPDGIMGVPYNFHIALIGDTPIVMDNSITKPSWMTVTLTGSDLYFTGTPDAAATDISIGVSFSNCSGTHSVSFADVIDVKGVPSLTEVSNTSKIVGGIRVRNQVFQVGPYVSAGNRYQLIVYSHIVEVTAASGDDTNAIVHKLTDAVKATTVPQWNEFGSDPGGNKPSAFDDRDSLSPPIPSNQVSIILNYQNQFAYGAYIS